MAKRKPPTLYALVDCNKLLIPVEQLGMFESVMQVEQAYEKNSEGKYDTVHWVSEIPKMPSFTLVGQEQITAWQVIGKMRTS
jgi:hypothetical protein